MQAAIKSLLTPEHQGELHRRFQLDDTSRLLSDWHAFTFEVTRDGQPLILRVTDSTHRTPEDILGELEWLAFTRTHGLTPLRALPSVRNFACETISADQVHFTAVLFEKLSGRAVGPADWQDPLFHAWGALTGRFHASSRTYRPVIRRKAWFESDFLNVDAYIPADRADLRSAAHALLAEIRALPVSPASYGMMHADIYQENFFLGPDDSIQLFDFDNCEYGFLVNDLAIALYAALWRVPPGEDREAFARQFLRAFLAGYATTHALPAGELARLPLFLRLRDLTIYLVMRKKLDLQNLKPGQQAVFNERESRLLAGRPVVAAAETLE